MEKDIKILKDETNALGLFFKCRNMDCYKKSLENILNELDRLQKENEELKERYKNKVKQMKEYRDENYIPKQVIIELIENNLEKNKDGSYLFYSNDCQTLARLLVNMIK